MLPYTRSPGRCRGSVSLDLQSAHQSICLLFPAICARRDHIAPIRKNLDRPIPHAHMSKRPQDGCHRLNHTLSGPVFPQTLGRLCEGKRKAAVLQNVSFLFWKAVIQCIHNANDFLRKGGYLDAENKNCLYPGSCNGSGWHPPGNGCWLA